MVMIDLKKNLTFKNIRRIYRILNVHMPEDLEDALKSSGAVIWSEFTKTAVNQYDVRGVIS